jgi:hypothetical protein
MRTSRGRESASVLRKIADARNDKRDENERLRQNRAETPKDIVTYRMLDGLYVTNLELQKLRRPYFLLYATATKAPHKEPDKGNWETLKSILGDLLNDGEYWGIGRENEYRVIYLCKNMTGEKLYQLHALQRIGWHQKDIDEEVLEINKREGMTDRFIKSKR